MPKCGTRCIPRWDDRWEEPAWLSAHLRIGALEDGEDSSPLEGLPSTHISPMENQVDGWRTCVGMPMVDKEVA